MVNDYLNSWSKLFDRCDYLWVASGCQGRLWAALGCSSHPRIWLSAVVIPCLDGLAEVVGCGASSIAACGG